LIAEAAEQFVRPGVVLVPTPIGHRGDLSLRAWAALSTADRIACEDTRHTGQLLKNYGIANKLLALHQHNEHQAARPLLEQVQREGWLLAVVSDAGLPGLSDPGFKVVETTHELALPVTVLPGANAALTALLGSGLNTEQFVFEGFLPTKKGRKSRLQTLAQEPRTLIFYESPHRLEKALGELAEHFGPERRACVARELTKVHETYHRGTLGELHAYFQAEAPKGEIVIIIQGKSTPGKQRLERTPHPIYG